MITYEYRISMDSIMTNNGVAEDVMVTSEAAKILQLLPRGAKYMGFEHLGLVSLNKSYVIKFEHPFFKEDIKIELDYALVAWANDMPDEYGHSISQDKILVGIKYINPDGTMRFPYMPRHREEIKALTVCLHSWQHYKGIREEYEFCVYCNDKKS